MKLKLEATEEITNNIPDKSFKRFDNIGFGKTIVI